MGTTADKALIGAWRLRIDAAVAAGHGEEARRIEQDAMGAFVYRKVWLRCGRGRFIWVRDK